MGLVPFDAPEANKGRYADVEDSSSSDGALPPPLPIAAPKKVLPLLAIGGLGLSTVKKDGENLTAEEMADASQLQSQLQQPRPVPGAGSGSSSETETMSEHNQKFEGGSHEGSLKDDTTGRGNEEALEQVVLGQPSGS